MEIFRIKLLHFSVFLVKQYTSLIYVKQNSFYLVNWTYPFVGPQGPISCSEVAKIFHAYEGRANNFHFHIPPNYQKTGFVDVFGV